MTSSPSPSNRTSEAVDDLLRAFKTRSEFWGTPSCPLPGWMAGIPAVAERYKKLEEALRFYSSAWMNNQHGSLDGAPSKRLLSDKGNKATEALAFDPLLY